MACPPRILVLLGLVSIPINALHGVHGRSSSGRMHGASTEATSFPSHDGAEPPAYDEALRMELSESRPRSRDRTRSSINSSPGDQEMRPGPGLIRAHYNEGGPPPSYEEAVGRGRPSVASVEAEVERITDYPPRKKLFLSSKYKTISCEYDRGTKTSRAALYFKLREQAAETTFIGCPETRAHTAFSAAYKSNGVISSYTRDEGDRYADYNLYVFPTPVNTSRDPILRLDVSTFRAERDSLHSAIRDRRRTTGEFSIFKGEIEDELSDDDEDEDKFRVDEKLSNFCSAVVYALKRQYGPFKDLCKIYRAVAEDARWRNQKRPE